MTVNRRTLLAASLTASAAATASAKAAEKKSLREAFRAIGNEVVAGISPGSPADQTQALQLAIDRAAESGAPVVLPAGIIQVADIKLRANTKLIGQNRAATLKFLGGAAFVTAERASDIVVDGVIFDGAWHTYDEGRGEGLLSLASCSNLRIANSEIRHSAKSGLSLTACSGHIADTAIHDVLDAGLKNLDATGIAITGNTVTHCGNNGILIWRSEKGEDGTIVSGNRVSNIRHSAGGAGEYGNGINVYRAGSVIVSNNRISDCAYTAVRGNAASNIQIIANSCERLGEVAIYAEFGFEGAIIANNLIDTAASGISVTNFNEGGRLAVIQGNLIRNLIRREFEKSDKRGEGIGVEADAAVTGNTIENAPTVGIQIGWGPFLRDVAVTGNIIRRATVGISVSSVPETGQCLIANNLISKSIGGAVRAMNKGAVFGPDLLREPPPAGRVSLLGNVAV